MKVSNMTSSNGNKIANQFIIVDDEGNEFFQSYNSIIVKVSYPDINGIGTKQVTLDSYYWNYSVTTGKYRNIFLGEDKKTTEKKIASGEYTLANLN